jgi:hypothetical protein
MRSQDHIINKKLIYNMKKIFLLFLLGAGLGIGCNKILVQSPESSLNAATAFTTASAIDAGIVGIYSGMQSPGYYGVTYTLFADMEADNLDHTGSFPTYQEVKNRLINPDNTDITNVWNQLYAVVNRANTVIASSANISDPNFNKNQAVAEAECLRAFVYFDIMRFWGGTPAGYSDPNGQGVPLVLTPTYAAVDATPKARSTAGQVFSQILNDLSFAVANLSDNSDAGRVNRNAAIAIKARVELYLNQYDSAAALSQQLLNQFSGATPNGGLAGNYANIYLLKNQQPESLFELQFSATNTNGLFFYYFGRDEVGTSSDLKAAHEPGDLRLPVNYFAEAGNVGAEKYSKADGTDDITLVRLAEMYLIHAESVLRGSNPDIATAQSDLNVVRNRAGLANTTASTVPDLETAILNENRVEFAHEAHRWFDLRRLGMPAALFGISDATKVLWPIPQSEVLTSGNVITQNPGY